MKKIDLVQLIGILANIGVILGIVFLGIEIRNSRTAIVAQTQDSVADGFNALNLAVINDPEIGLVFQRGLCDPENLSDAEATRVSMQLRALFNQYRRVYRLYEQGLIDEPSWELYATEAAQFLSSPGGEWHFSVNEIEPDFRAAIEGYSLRAQNVELRPGRDELEVCK